MLGIRWGNIMNWNLYTPFSRNNEPADLLPLDVLRAELRSTITALTPGLDGEDRELIFQAALGSLCKGARVVTSDLANIAEGAITKIMGGPAIEAAEKLAHVNDEFDLTYEQQQQREQHTHSNIGPELFSPEFFKMLREALKAMTVGQIVIGGRTYDSREIYGSFQQADMALHDHREAAAFAAVGEIASLDSPHLMIGGKDIGFKSGEASAIVAKEPSKFSRYGIKVGIAVWASRMFDMHARGKGVDFAALAEEEAKAYADAKSHFVTQAAASNKYVQKLRGQLKTRAAPRMKSGFVWISALKMLTEAEEETSSSSTNQTAGQNLSMELDI